MRLELSEAWGQWEERGRGGQVTGLEGRSGRMCSEWAGKAKEALSKRSARDSSWACQGDLIGLGTCARECQSGPAPVGAF